MKIKLYSLIVIFLFSEIGMLSAYPIDGYLLTGIRRLLHLQLVEKGTIKGKKLIPGAKKSIDSIQLHLVHNSKGDSLINYPAIDPSLQKKLNALFPRMDESYSWSLLDITPGKPLRYAERKSSHQYQPGSVGKLAVITGFFSALTKVYPDCFEQRKDLMRNKKVRAGYWAIYDEHTIPIFDTTTNRLIKRQVRESDIFSLYEWVDHMMSVSNNGAASVVMREVVLMNVFGSCYPILTEAEANEYFKTTPKSTLAELARSAMNDPMRVFGIEHEEYRLGGFFTRGAGSFIPRKGGSTGSPKGLMKWMIALERGQIVDEKSSLEIKRLMYMTGRRIRYAASAALRTAGVYFKSGSLYSCNRTLNPSCGKYRGNVKNFMNSVAIIEHEDGTSYLISLMSNVLNKNSANDHYALAAKIDRVVREKYTKPK